MLQYHVNTPTCFDPQGDHLQGIISKQHITKSKPMHTVDNCKKVKQLKCRRFFVVQLYNGPWCSVSAAAYVLNEG